MNNYPGINPSFLLGISYFSFVTDMLLSVSFIISFCCDQFLAIRYAQFTPNLQNLSLSILGSAIITLHFQLRESQYSMQFLEPIGSFFLVCFLLYGENVQCKQYCQKEYQPFNFSSTKHNKTQQILFYGLPFYIDFFASLFIQFTKAEKVVYIFALTVDAICSLVEIYEAILSILACFSTLSFSKRMNITQQAFMQAVISLIYVISLLVGKICYSVTEISCVQSPWDYGWLMWVKDLVQETLYIVCGIIILANCYQVCKKIQFTYNLLNDNDQSSSF